jgi:multiple sugar transport system ATP-binding protein
MAEVRFEGATRRFPGSGTPAVDRLDLSIEDGEFMVLVGPSGCGKSTTLRMLAGFEDVDSGSVHIGSRDVTRFDPKDRDVSMVFQNYALYPHMTVEQNIGFHLKIAKMGKDKIRDRVAEAAKLLDLRPYVLRKPAKLSGGQRQRVAMGRSVVREPSVFLMDEPLSNLDAQLRTATRTQIASLQARLGITTVYVTHDQVEAMTMGHRVAVLKDGILQQCDTPGNLYRSPVNTFVATFMGSPAMNLFTAGVADNEASIDGARLPLSHAQIGLLDTAEVTIGVRPDGMLLTPADGAELLATVDLVEELGCDAYAYCSVAVKDQDVVPAVVRVDPRCVPARGSTVGLQIRSGEQHVFHAGTGHRLPA